jgi:putative two-component system response regulator
VIWEEPAEHAKILIVDDEYANVRVMERILARAGYEHVASTTDPREVASLCRRSPPDLVLLDLRMPHLDGFDVLSQLVESGPEEDYLPVIVLTADDSKEAKKQALSAGAADFLSKPFQPFEILLRIRNLLRSRQLYCQLQDRNRQLEDRVIRRTRDLERSQREMLERLTQAVETRDGETGAHTRRVGEISARLARALGLPDERVDLIRHAAPLHDVGKIGIPDAILMKTGPLTVAEFEVVKTHTTLGAKILCNADSSLMRMAEQIALSHHERWDGTGYPHGAGGEAIPIEARIVAVVDVFDALSHDRCYRDAWPIEKVLAEIERDSGRYFDPAVARAFLALPDPVGMAASFDDFAHGASA